MHNIQNQRALECADVGTSAYNILLCLLQNTRNYKHASNLKRITRDAAVDTHQRHCRKKREQHTYEEEHGITSSTEGERRKAGAKQKFEDLTSKKTSGQKALSGKTS